MSNIHTGIRLGSLQATNHVIKRVCCNEESIIVTLDLDDCLLRQREAEPSVVERIRECFFQSDWSGETKYLVALGGMVRTETFKNYPLCLDGNIRFTPAVGNVWKHVRCFKKRLFDAIPCAHFRVNGEWISHHGSDWAFMVPIVEQAGQDRVFEFPSHLSLYFYEQSNKCEDKQQELDKVAEMLRSIMPYRRHVHVPAAAPELLAKCVLPSHSVEGHAPCVLHTFKQGSDGSQARVLVLGGVRGGEDVPVRIHSECFSGDVLGSKRCDCGCQLASFFEVMGQEGNGVLVYVSGQEGRGNGWDNKAVEYELADKYPERNHDELLRSIPDCVSDRRDYSQLAATLQGNLGIKSVCLYTNNQKKVAALEAAFSPSRIKIVPVPADMTNPHSRKYLLEKVSLLGHDIRLVGGTIRERPGITVSHRLLSIVVCSLFEWIPFENLSLIIGGVKTTLPGESLGLCFDRNVRLLHVLQALGFCNVRAIGARTRVFCEKGENILNCARGIPLPFDHVALLVELDGRNYLVDIGNGVPYFKPLDISRSFDSPSAVGKHSVLEYRVRKISTSPDLFAMEHNRPRERLDVWKRNYEFFPSDVLSLRDIDKIVTAHASDPQFGHMLHSLRMNRWSLHRPSIVLRNTTACVIQPNGEQAQFEIQTGYQLATFVETNFGQGMKAKLDAAAPILLKYVELKEAAVSPFRQLLESYILHRMPSTANRHAKFDAVLMRRAACVVWVSMVVAGAAAASYRRGWMKCLAKWK